MTASLDASKSLRIWLPAVRVGTGADVFVLRLARALERAGHQPMVQWFDRRYELLPELLRLNRVPEGIDVIHANSWNACAFLGRGIPVVTTVLHLVHDPAYAPYRSVSQAIYHRWHVRWREARAVRRSAAVTAISNYVGQTVRDAFGRQSVQVISNWIDTDLYSPAQGYGLPGERRFRLLMVGNRSRRKGYDLLPAFARALGPQFELRCTGGLRDHDGHLDGSSNVVTLGRLSEEALIQEYRQCDAVVSLSRYEGFGYTVLEGMACGKPFVGFNTSALTEVVDDGGAGFLVPVDDVSALAGRCCQLLENPSMLSQMGEVSRDRAVSAFSEVKAVTSYLSIYRHVLSINK
jgi:glycosyltransferase involved in cell wall biosynthesis